MWSLPLHPTLPIFTSPRPRFPVNASDQICRNLAATLRGNDIQFTALLGSTGRSDELSHDKAETAPPSTYAAARAAADAAADVITRGDSPSGASRNSERAERLGALEGDHLMESVGTFLAETSKRTDCPLLLTGALEMLAAALVILPREDIEGAMRCAG